MLTTDLTEKPYETEVRAKSIANLADLAETDLTLNEVKSAESEDNTGWRLLHQAADEGHIKMVNKLILAGADVNITENNGGTPLHCASNKGHLSVITALVGARADVNKVNKWGWSALHFACSHGHKLIVKALINAGANINLTTNEGTTAILLSSSKGHLEVVNMLIVNKVDVNISTNDGYSPIFAASREEKIDVICSLLGAGADGTISNNFINGCSDETRSRILNVLIENGGRIDNIIKFLNNFKDNRMKKIFFLNSNFSLNAFTSNNNRFWVYLIQNLDIEGLNYKITDYINRYPELVYVNDKSGNLAVNTALPSYQGVLKNRMCLLHDRYRIISRPIYISATCIVFKALDYNTRDSQNNPKEVAIKLLKFKSQFMKEINFRKTDFSEEFVMSISSTHTSSGRESWDDTISIDRLIQFNKYSASNSHIDTSTTQNLPEKPTNKNILSKNDAEKLFCIVMPLAETNLSISLKQERLSGRSLEEIKDIFLNLVRCVEYLHSKGLVHGDITPMNIVYDTEFGWKLLDLDASGRIGIDTMGSKSSSAYSPPEMIYIDDMRNIVLVKNVNNLISAGLDMSLALLAHPSFDIWSLGCVLYQLANTSSYPLFQGDLNDNISDSDFFADNLHTLYKWHERTKKDKLSLISDPLLRNLLSQMLTKNPSKRPNISRIVAHPFITGKEVHRLIGEEAEYDVYISYRSVFDFACAEKLYNSLVMKGLKVWWDKKSIPNNEYNNNFIQGLVNCKMFVPIVTRNSINNPSSDKYNFSKFNPDSSSDDLLLEYRLAIEFVDLQLIDVIYPIHIANENELGIEIVDIYPKTHDIIISSIEIDVRHFMELEALHSPHIPDRPVSYVVNQIKYKNNILIDHDYDHFIEDVAIKINDEITIINDKENTKYDIKKELSDKNITRISTPSEKSENFNKFTTSPNHFEEVSSVHSGFSESNNSNKILTSASTSKLQVHKAQIVEKNLEITNLQSENSILNEEVTYLTLKVKEYEKQLELVQIKERLKMDIPKSLRNSFSENNDTLININKEKEKEIDALKIELSVLKSDFEKEKSKNESLISKISHVKEDYNKLEEEKGILKKKNSILKEEVLKLKEQVIFQVEQSIRRNSIRK